MDMDLDVTDQLLVTYTEFVRCRIKMSIMGTVHQIFIMSTEAMTQDRSTVHFLNLV